MEPVTRKRFTNLLWLILGACLGFGISSSVVPRFLPPLALLHSEMWMQITGMIPGQVAFNLPATMKQGEARTVAVRISTNTIEDLNRGLPGVTRSEEIKVAPYMTVMLKGDSEAFEIIPLTPDEQFISTDTYTQWQFHIRPLKSGIQELDLLIGVRIKKEGSTQESRFYPTFERKVDVTIDRGWVAKRFFTKNWKWIVGTLLLPIAWFLIKKKYGDHEDESETESEKTEPQGEREEAGSQRAKQPKPQTPGADSDDDNGLE
jgi:hypothetical protein